MNKELSKEIMHRTRLRNNSLRNDLMKCLKQRNYCASLRKTKKTYYNNLNERKITDSKSFWKPVNAFLSDRTSNDEKITLIKKHKINKTDIRYKCFEYFLFCHH